MGRPFGTGATAHRAAGCRWEVPLEHHPGALSVTRAGGLCHPSGLLLDPRRRIPTLDERLCAYLGSENGDARSRPEPAVEKAPEPCTAESAECTCPDFCERDHDND